MKILPVCIPSLYPLHDKGSCFPGVVRPCSWGVLAIQHRAPASRLVGNLSAGGVPTFPCCRRSSGSTDVASIFVPRWYDLNPIFRCAARGRGCRMCEPLYLTPFVGVATKKVAAYLQGKAGRDRMIVNEEYPMFGVQTRLPVPFDGAKVAHFRIRCDGIRKKLTKIFLRGRYTDKNEETETTQEKRNQQDTSLFGQTFCITQHPYPSTHCKTNDYILNYCEPTQNDDCIGLYRIAFR